MNALTRSTARLSLTIALTALNAGLALADELPPPTGDIDAAFGIHQDWLSDPWELPESSASGFDLDQIRIEADPSEGPLRIGLRMASGAIAGDSDGDGDADSGTLHADAPRFGVGEQVSIELDLDDDDLGDVAVRIDARGSVDGCGLFKMQDGIATDERIGDCTVPAIGPETPDLVIDIADFRPLRRSWLPDHAKRLDFGVKVIVDTAHDAHPADTAPDTGFYGVCPFGGSVEVCDGVDEDCDGIVDEDTREPCEEPELADGPALGDDMELPAGCSASPGRSAPTGLGVLLLGLWALRRRAR